MANAQNAAQTDAKADEKVEAKSASPASLKEKYNEAIKSPLYSAEVKKVAAGVYEMFSAVATDDKRRELMDAIASAANGRDQAVLTAAYEELQALNKAHAHNNKVLNEVRGKYSFEEIVQVYSDDFMKLAYQVSYEVLRHSSELKLAASSAEKRGRKNVQSESSAGSEGEPVSGEKSKIAPKVYEVKGPDLSLEITLSRGKQKWTSAETSLLEALNFKYKLDKGDQPIFEEGQLVKNADGTTVAVSRSSLAKALAGGAYEGFSAKLKDNAEAPAQA